MRLYTFAFNGSAHVGAERDGALADLSGEFGDMIALIAGGESALHVALALRDATETLIPFDAVKILAPIPRPGKIFCSGLNYKSHVTENPNAKFLDDPNFFIKLPQAVIGPGEAIRIPDFPSVDKMDLKVDYEVELAVIIGKEIYRPTPDEAMNAVFGYTILHDVSARTIQFKDNNEDMGKNFDTFAPLGPCIVTKDEIPDPSKLRLRSFVNNQRMQDGSNEDWRFDLPRLLAWFSLGITLNPGDVITTGTPAGIGFFRSPQVFLKPGDVCRLEIDGIGALENPVLAA